jgi:hypothetical protein
MLKICYYFYVVVEMSTEGTSKRSTKHNRSPTSRERANERQRLWYQRNKDAINQRRRLLYHRRTRESNTDIDFPHSRKYRSLADIMQRTFPMNVSFPESFHNPHISTIPQSSNNIHFIGQTSLFPEDHHVHRIPTNGNLHTSANGSESIENEAIVQNMQDRVTDVIQEQVPSTEVHVRHVLSRLLQNLQTPPANIAPSFHNHHSVQSVVPPTESIIPHTISLGTTKVFQSSFMMTIVVVLSFY